MSRIFLSQKEVWLARYKKGYIEHFSSCRTKYSLVSAIFFVHSLLPSPLLPNIKIQLAWTTRSNVYWKSQFGCQWVFCCSSIVYSNGLASHALLRNRVRLARIHVPRRASREGTPVDTRSCALCSEGLVPRGCEGLLAPFFLKLVAIPSKLVSTWVRSLVPRSTLFWEWD